MIITVIQCDNYDNAKQQIQRVYAATDGVELRLDYSNILDLNAIAKLRHEYPMPMIFTLRKKSQGGFYRQDDTQRLQDILALCEISPDYIDLEYDLAPDFYENLKLLYPHIKLICSYHNFNETPVDLVSIFQSMQHPCFDVYKLATTANSTLDALRLMRFVSVNCANVQLTGICMGDAGQSTRILSPVIGNTLHYASAEDAQATAPGQLTTNELLTVYSFRKLDRATKIYALLGDPVSLSVGHILHNQNLEILHENAVYIKLRVTADDLPEVIKQCRLLPFAGFSITMPLKESIIPLLDGIDSLSKPINAINSVILENGRWVGFNTDGSGAIQAITERLDITMQTVVILGAGGAARAIAYEALQRNANVIILNRTAIRAARLAAELGCTSGDLASLGSIRCAVVINTLPSNVFFEKSIKEWLHDDVFLSKNIVMDIVYNPINTSFLKRVKQANCTCVFGYEMYINQAIMQLTRWFNPSASQLCDIKQSMHQYFVRGATDASE